MLTKTRITKEDKVVVLTGAGISAESGVKTFRDSDGLWENHPLEEVATPEGFIRNPALVWDFYSARHNQLETVKPNPGHHSLKMLEDYLGANLLLVTQNIDGLHQEAGSENVLEMHGTIHQSYCNRCGDRVPTGDVIAQKRTGTQRKWFKCRICSGYYRPDIVWFGEIPYHLEKIYIKLKECTKFIVIGTSGVVYPAAQFLLIAKQYGAYTIGVNREAPENVGYIEEFHKAQSGQLLPFLIPQWIG